MEDDIFNEANKPESAWFKFEKVGDRVSGKLLEITDKGPNGDFPSQRVWTLLQSDGSVINVGYKLYKDEKKNDLSLSFVADRLRNARPGDRVGFLFEKEIPNTVKGYAAAKSIQPFLVPGTPEPVVEKILDKDFN